MRAVRTTTPAVAGAVPAIHSGQVVKPCPAIANQDALLAAAAVRAAHRQGQFGAFRAQRLIPGAPLRIAALRRVVQDFSLDLACFNHDLAASDVYARVRQNLQSAAQPQPQKRERRYPENAKHARINNLLRGDDARTQIGAARVSN